MSGARVRKRVCEVCLGHVEKAQVFRSARRYASTTASSTSVDKVEKAGPSRSIIFDNPLDHSARAKKLKRVRRLEHVEQVKAERSEEEERERLGWWNDPWYKMSRSPMRQCQITRQLHPSAIMINFRAANLNVPSGNNSPDKDAELDGTYLFPDRVLHPRFSPRKAGLGMWALCHHDVISRLSGPGPHKQFLNRTKAQVGPDLHELVYLQLCQRVEQELRLLHERLRGKNRSVETRLRQAERGLGLGLEEEERVVLRRLKKAEAEKVGQGRWEDERAVALFELGGLPTWTPGRRDSPVEGGSSQKDDAVTSSAEEEAPFVVHIPVGTAIPLVKTPKTDIPIYTPASILPPALHASSAELFGKLLREEKMELARAKEVRGILTQRSSGGGEGQSIQEALSSDDTLSGEDNEEMSNMVVLSTHPLLSGSSRPGHYGVDLAIAFWRLRCYLGEGWVEYDADKRGRRV